MRTTSSRPSENAPPINHGLSDPRNVQSGIVLHDVGGYYDGQSLSGNENVVSLVFHHSHNHEGGAGLRLYHSTSRDCGKTWDEPRPVQDSLTCPSHDGYQFAHPRKKDTLFLVYGFNPGKLHYKTPKGNVDLPRGDMQLESGFHLKVSKDGGSSFSKKDYIIPVRRTAIDRANPWAGATMGAFHCDKPSVIGTNVYFSFQKTVEGGGETPFSEVFIMKSPNLLEVDDPKDATWETLPSGDVGLKWDSRLSLGEEPHVLSPDPSDPSKLLVIWRTEAGILAYANSKDGGHSFEEPRALTYDGVRVMKNPRGSFTPHCFPDGSYLMIYYNNGHTERDGYVGRRYYWYTYGVPDQYVHSGIFWNEPELALWWDGESLDDRPNWNADWAIVDGPGYPDFHVLPDGSLSFVESNKLTLRLHTVDPRMLHFLRNQRRACEFVRYGLVKEIRKPCGKYRGMMLPDARGGGGFSIVVVLKAREEQVKPKQMIVDGREIVTAAQDEEDLGQYITKGFYIAVEGRGNAGLQLSIMLTDGKHQVKHFTDSLKFDGAWHSVCVTFDSGPRIVTSCVDSMLNDGAEHAPEGWTAVPQNFASACGSTLNFMPEPTVRFPSSGKFGGEVGFFGMYNRPLLNSEAIGMNRWLLSGEGRGGKL